MKTCAWVGAVLAALAAALAVLVLRSPSNSSMPPLGSGAMFDSIAGQYDVTNRFLSLGMDMQWRRALLQGLQLKPGDRVLDLATGTADVAIMVAEALKALSAESGAAAAQSTVVRVVCFARIYT
jgi:ubiE/COQ5 methyltransferase family